MLHGKVLHLVAPVTYHPICRVTYHPICRVMYHPICRVTYHPICRVRAGVSVRVCACDGTAFHGLARLAVVRSPAMRGQVPGHAWSGPPPCVVRSPAMRGQVPAMRGQVPRHA